MNTTNENSYGDEHRGNDAQRHRAVTGWFFEKLFVKQKGIPAKQEGAGKYGMVQDLLSDGWTFNRP